VKTQVLRQGDVLIILNTGIPSEAKPLPLENGRLILAHGEVTGHAHVIEGDATFLAADLDEMADRFLRVEEECQVVHDEHTALTIPPGQHTVRRQREYAPEAIRNVAD
jgi:hypothetical protein